MYRYHDLSFLTPFASVSYKEAQYYKQEGSPYITKQSAVERSSQYKFSVCNSNMDHTAEH